MLSRIDYSYYTKQKQKHYKNETKLIKNTFLSCVFLYQCCYGFLRSDGRPWVLLRGPSSRNGSWIKWKETTNIIRYTRPTLRTSWKPISKPTTNLTTLPSSADWEERNVEVTAETEEEIEGGARINGAFEVDGEKTPTDVTEVKKVPFKMEDAEGGDAVRKPPKINLKLGMDVNSSRQFVK